MRLTRIQNGATLVATQVYGSPGIWIGNDITRAGVT
mgnify:CR=1 FL=1